MYQNGYKGLDKAKLLLQMAYPSQSLKVFPPHFIIREVMIEQLERWRHKANPCIFLYFDIKQYSDLKMSNSYEIVHLINEAITHSFRTVLTLHIPDDELLGVQRYYDDDYVVLIKASERYPAYQQREAFLNQLKMELEKEVKERISAITDFSVQFHTACVQIDPVLEAHEAFHTAMHEARELAKGKLYSDTGNIKAQIRRIIQEEDIRVLAQPIVSFASGTIMGWEILTRGPENTPFTLPLKLFDFADQAELLISLELLVIKKALMEIERKSTTSPIFINVTVPSLKSNHFYQEVIKLMEQFPQVCPEQIVFEITERHSIDDLDDFTDSIAPFRRTGFKFAIDDTGAGYASLNVIAKVLPDIIKVDRSIIQNINDNAANDSVLQALLFIAEKIGSEVVAEGIETEAEANVLLKKRVTFGQGFFFSRPQEPFPEMQENWVMKQKPANV